MKNARHAAILLLSAGLALSARAAGADRARTVAKNSQRSLLACSTAVGETLTDVRAWLGIAVDGSQDTTVRVVDLSASTANATFQLSSGKDVVCGSTFNDTLSAGELRKGDVVLGGAGDDSLNYVLGGMFRGGDGVDPVGALGLGTFDAGAGNDQVNDGFAAGTYLGGDGDDYVYAMAGGTFDGGAGTDASYLFTGGALANVEECTLIDNAVCR